MKILWISNLYPNSAQPNRATFNRQHVHHLRNHAEVRVIAPVAWPDALQARKAGKNIAALDSESTRHPTFFYPPRLFRSAYGKLMLASVSSVWKSWARPWSPDVIVGSWAYPDGYVATRFARQLGIPAVIKVHGSDIHSLEAGARMEQTRMVLKEADGILSVSQDLKEQIGDMGVAPDKVNVIYNGVDRERFVLRDKMACRRKLKLSVSADEKLVLYIGNLKRVKGVDRLIAGFCELRRQHPAHLAIVGGGEEQASLTELTRTLGLANAVTFHGAVDHDVIPDWLSACDTFALCSRNEGVPNVLLEAMASGRPSVASRVGGIPEVVIPGETGFIVDSSNPQAVSDALVNVLQTNWNETQIRNHSERYSWESNATKTIELILRSGAKAEPHRYGVKDRSA